MASFTPVDHNPFESKQLASPVLTPVDHDPFAVSTPDVGLQPKQSSTTWDTIKTVASEPFKLAGEMVAAPLNAVIKASKGYAGLASMAKAGLQGKSFDESLQSGVDTIGNRNVVSSPFGASKTSEFLGEKVIQPGIQKLGEITGQPELVQGAAEVGGDALALMAVKPGIRAVKGLADKATDLLPKPNVDQLITSSYEKAVRPSVVGKRTSGQIKAAEANQQSGVKKIVELKDQGQLMLDSTDGPVVRLPETLKEFSESITQAKGKVFNEYDAMAKAAGEQGATVELAPIANELTTIAGDNVLRVTNPASAEYAQSWSKRLQDQGSFTAEEAQQAIKSMNTSLDSFYKNPTYDTAVKAYTDSLVANRLRSALDTSIEALQGEGYQGLKSQYGALKSLEKEVNHRAVVDGRKSVAGLLDFSDIFSGSQVLHGALSLNPTTVASGLGAHFIKRIYKKMNDPNVQIKNMFKRVDKHMERPTPVTPAETIPSLAADVAPVMDVSVNESTAIIPDAIIPPVKDPLGLPSPAITITAEGTAITPSQLNSLTNDAIAPSGLTDTQINRAAGNLNKPFIPKDDVSSVKGVNAPTPDVIDGIIEQAKGWDHGNYIINGNRSNRSYSNKTDLFPWLENYPGVVPTDIITALQKRKAGERLGHREKVLVDEALKHEYGKIADAQAIDAVGADELSATRDYMRNPTQGADTSFMGFAKGGKVKQTFRQRTGKQSINQNEN